MQDIDDLLTKLDEWEENMPQMLEEAAAEATNEFLPILAGHIEDEFSSAIEDFYSDYSPKSYRRHGGLFDILVLDIPAGGMAVSETLKAGFDPYMMTPFRSGYSDEDGLYDVVFRKGWHGGARHPTRGLAYWRTGRRFSRWGQRAARADPAPLDDFKRRMEDYLQTQGVEDFKRLLMDSLSQRGWD